MGAEGPLRKREPWRARALLSLLQLTLVFVVFWKAGTYAARRRVANLQLSATTSKTSSSLTEHPIPKLMADAEDAFRAKLKRQSTSLGEAVAEYKRRYGRDPPKGFDKWYWYAVKNKFVLKDEFDAIDEDLRPFWAMSGQELRRRVDQVGHLPSISLVRVSKGKVTALNLANNIGQDKEVSARAHGFRRMIEKVGNRLPDMDFPINGKAEGRILIPWEHKEYPEMSVQDSSAGIDAILGDNFTADWGGEGSVWESWRRTCPPFSKARRKFVSMKPTGHARRHAMNLLNLHHPSSPPSSPPSSTPVADLPSDSNPHFVSNVDSSFDFCTHPAAHYQQGHFFSDWRTLPVLFPVFSPAKAQGYADVRIPSHYYHQATGSYSYGWDTLNLKAKEFDDAEVPWAEKEDVVFWRGATTGGGNSPAGFQPQYQRHRLVRMASSESAENVTVVFPSPAPGAPRSSVPALPYTTAPVPIAQLNEEIMDVAFVRKRGREIYPGGRAALRKDHRFAKSVPLGHHWKYKYLVDVDGMGYSGRFFAFLASDSVPIKATVYEEFFSDWLQPWLHYIPLSQNYEELYNIFAFFSGPTPSMLKAANLTSPFVPLESNENQVLLRRIARAGKVWKNTMGRRIDMEIYVYRLALEWARLWADDREAMSFYLPLEDDWSTALDVPQNV